MATAWRKVKRENDIGLTIQDAISIHHGELDYARYDSSACQWNQFSKNFRLDKYSGHYSNELKAASILWKEVRVSKSEEKYSRKLLIEYADKIEGYYK